MKVNYSQLLTNLAGIVGIAGCSLVITLPSQAKEATNPNPSIFSEAPYSRSQRIEANSNYTPAQATQDTAKGTTANRNLVAQKTKKRGLNPNPSIFNEPPYNRGASSANTSSGETAPTPTTPAEAAPTTPTTEAPSATPTAPATETPSATPSTPSNTAPTQTQPAPNSSSTQNKNLVAIAESNGSFKTLTQALKAAGLTATLEGKDNFTIFAPTDAAFSKLPQDAVWDLLKPENKEVLIKILTYHVVPGKVLSSDLKSGEVKSVEGGAINVKVDPATGVKVNEATVTQADITGSNGVIHAIDQVILPPDL
ncbi:fasciclin domain-containing protein [Tolypothrix sp. PCC 7601]|uniref:fasciclin domain-containing protein n=1 Tax=Tolypothrix sp. PCC 7601 TaxID=1188 RepID=UPI0005EAA444|nr:fasciclin domain-containing protein [Tolypothrix sp. PCC 7601]EKE96942.1 cell adhesion fasciclin protein [Tolypothrix sp. PCC 7601]